MLSACTFTSWQRRGHRVKLTSFEGKRTWRGHAGPSSLSCNDWEAAAADSNCEEIVMEAESSDQDCSINLQKSGEMTPSLTFFILPNYLSLGFSRFFLSQSLNILFITFVSFLLLVPPSQSCSLSRSIIYCLLSLHLFFLLLLLFFFVFFYLHWHFQSSDFRLKLHRLYNSCC